MKQRKRNMYYFTEDLWAIILAKLPLKIVTSFKLVCKQWTSIVESTYFRDLFISQHQPSSWSLMCRDYRTEVLVHYRCDTWGLERSPGSYISSFLTDKFENQKDKYRGASVVAYSDAGLILIRVVNIIGNLSLYVANPVSGEFVELIVPPLGFWPVGITTRIDNGVILSYRVVSYDECHMDEDGCILSLMIYSSETGLWNRETVHSPIFFLFEDGYYSISLNENLHLLAYNIDNVEVVFSIDYDAACHVTPFPDVEKFPRFRRCCTTSQGNLMYMNNFFRVKDDGRLENKVCVWTLKSWEWQLVSEISMETDYIPVAINPFDATTAYVRRTNHQCLLSINLDNGEFKLHNESERSRYCGILSSVNCPKDILGMRFSSFVLPKWLHRIPNTVRRV